MLSAGRWPALLARTLLMLQQFVKTGALGGCQNGAKLFPGSLQFLANGWSHWFHQTFGAFLARGDNLIDLRALFRCQIQFTLRASQEFEPCAQWRRRREWAS